MNVNSLILSLKDVAKCPVVPDLYTGEEDKWIVFTYADERGALFGDNREEYEEATIQVTLYTPFDYNFMTDKKNIKKALIDLGFQVQSIQSWCEDNKKAGSYIRHTVFTCYYVALSD